MKTFKTLPGNDGFFQKYITLIPTLNVLGYLAQVVSALTEFGVIYTIIYNSLAEFWPDAAAPVGIVGAVVGTAFLEVGLRKFAPYSVRAILEKRYTGLDLPMTVFIFAACIALLSSSGTLSFTGSKSIVKAVAPPPDQQSTLQADSAAQVATVTAWSTYRADSIAIAARYAPQTEAITQAATAAIQAKRGQLRSVESREKAGTRYTTQKNVIRADMAAIEADRAAKLADLEQSKGTELRQAQEARNNAISKADATRDRDRATVTAYNAEQQAKSEAQVKSYGGNLGWFTILCLAIFLLSVALNEIHAKGSEVTEVTQVSPYTFAPGVLAETTAAIAERLNQRIRAKIATFADATPAPPLPAQVAQLYDATGITAPRARLEVSAQDGGVITLPVKRHQATAQEDPDPDKALDYLKAAEQLRAAQLPQQAQEMELQAETVLSLYLGPDNSPDALKRLKLACLDHLQGKAPNPFAHHHRRPIGFTQAAQDTPPGKDPLTDCVNDALTATAAKGKIGQCIQCGNNFEKRTTWQKYCCEDCKKAYHAARHGGTAFDPTFKPWKQ